MGVLSGKLKILDRAYDELKLLKRGCKAVSKSSVRTAAFTVAADGGVSGCLEGAIDHKVYDPDTGNIITDIDLFENGVMWELKSAIYADASWLDKHVDLKLANYLKCRALLPGYESAPIGFRFTTSGMDSLFRAALQERFSELRQAYPDLDLRLEIAD